MTQTSKGASFSLAFVVFMMTLAAAAGAVLTVLVGTIAAQVGPRADRQAASEPCQCDNAERSAGDEASRELVDQEGEVRRAFLAALARNPRYDAASALPPEALPPPAVPAEYPEFSGEHQEGGEMPSPDDIVEQEWTSEQQDAEAASLEGELNEEPIDPVWAPATEQATARAIAATGSMYLDDVTCRESLCRVRVTHRNLAARDDDVEKLLGTMPGGGQARVYAPHDEPTTVMYFSREGKQLTVLTPGVPWVPASPLDASSEVAEGEGEIPPPPVMPQ